MYSVAHEIPKATSDGKKIWGNSGASDMPTIDASNSSGATTMLKFAMGEAPWRLVEYGDAEYPPLLRLINAPPRRLYVMGAPLGSRCYVAVAGTREPSQRGAELAYALGRELAMRGYSVVTGGARGVDAQAWEGARSAGGHAVVVAPFLFENGRPWRRIGPNEAVVAEVLESDPLSAKRLLAARNRIIAGMSAAVVIPDARCRAVGGRCAEGGWGTRYAAEFGVKAGRLVVVLEPESDEPERALAFKHLLDMGATPARNLGEALQLVEGEVRKMCQDPQDSSGDV